MSRPIPPIQPTPEVLDIAHRLERAGFETWCVGGAVRDALLGAQPTDWDLATAATPDEVRGVFGGRRTIPVGVAFGTVGVLDRDGVLHEVTTFRRDVRTDGRHAEVEFGGSIDDDLARRDFTINAIAWHPGRGVLRDPFDGRGDLERRVVRAVGDPDARMAEDRLRALRAVRFAGRLQFRLDDATWDAIVSSAPHLGRLSAERVKQEIEKTMEQVARPAAAFAMWQRSGAFRTLVPSLAEVREDDLAVLDHLPGPRPGGRPFRALVRLAALFGASGARGVGDAMGALRFSKADTNRAAAVVERAGRLEDAVAEWRRTRGDDVPDAALVRRWTATVGRLYLPTVVRLAHARDLAAGRGSDAWWRRVYRRMTRSAYRDPLDAGDLAVDGDDLRRAGIPPGPALGKILHALVEAVLDDPARNDPGTLLAIARERHAAGGYGAGGTAAGDAAHSRT